jgi:light-regulated signal transduction histidine kinase (bacteriophytochrome)
MFFMHKYLNKKHFARPFFLSILFYSAILLGILQLFLFLKTQATSPSGLYLATILTTIIIVVAGILSFRAGQNSLHSPAETASEDHRTALIRDLQNENKYFSKVLSHDLRSPLSSIVLLASYLKTKNENSEINRYIELIEQSAYKELAMMAILLSLMRKDAIKSENMQELEIRNAAQTLIPELEAELGQKQIKTELHIPAALRILTYPDSFNLVLKTVLQHAVHYSDPGQSLEIKTIEDHRQVEIVLEFTSSQLKGGNSEQLFSSEHLLKDTIKTFPESVDLYFCRKISGTYNGTVHVQATEHSPVCRFILTVNRPLPESIAK